MNLKATVLKSRNLLIIVSNINLLVPTRNQFGIEKTTTKTRPMVIAVNMNWGVSAHANEF